MWVALGKQEIFTTIRLKNVIRKYKLDDNARWQHDNGT